MSHNLTPIPPISWTPGNKPNTPLGTSILMWVTYRNLKTGKLTVGMLNYANAYVLALNEVCDPPACVVPHNPDEHGEFEDYEWTCWFNDACQMCDTIYVWEPYHQEIIAHAPVVFPEPTAQTDCPPEPSSH